MASPGRGMTWAAFNSPTRPGLDFSGNGRGNNTLGGWFDVLQVEYLPGGGIGAFAVDFRQYDESEQMTGPSTYGSLRINSSIPLHFTDLHATPTPLPPAAVMFLTGAFALVHRRRARRA